MRRSIPALAALLASAAITTAGCQTPGSRLEDQVREQLILGEKFHDQAVSRAFNAPFDDLTKAAEVALKDRDFLKDPAAKQVNRTTSWSSHKARDGAVAVRSLEVNDRKAAVRVERTEAGCVVSARVSTGATADPAASAGLLDRVAGALETPPAGR